MTSYLDDIRTIADQVAYTRAVISERNQLEETSLWQTERIAALIDERDEYQCCADDMAAAHKVERDGLDLENQKLCDALYPFIDFPIDTLESLSDHPQSVFTMTIPNVYMIAAWAALGESK